MRSRCSLITRDEAQELKCSRRCGAVAALYNTTVPVGRSRLWLHPDTAASSVQPTGAAKALALKCTALSKA